MINYVRKVLELGCNAQSGDTLIIYSTFDISDLKDVLMRIKDDYKIKDIVFISYDHEKIYNFLKNNPSDEDIKNFITKYPLPNQNDRVKVIYVNDDDFGGYYDKLNSEMHDLFTKYYEYDFEFNKSIYDLINMKDYTIISWPTSAWARSVLGNENRIQELWNLVTSCIPDSPRLKEEIERLQQIREYLNKSNISRLYFHTDLGTDFRISLSKHSNWVSALETREKIEYFSNFPSYELYTSPNYNSAEGKVVLSKPSYLSGYKVKQADLSFTKGKLTAVNSDNDSWAHIVLKRQYDLFRVGEIALVSNDTPIARLNAVFNSVLLDENTGCHLALGNSCTEAITLPKSVLEEKGLKHYNFNSSKYHQDLVFGNSSINVEAQTRDKRKILLMENGQWKI